jgi:hypothetical protein
MASTSHGSREMARFAPAALQQNPGAKTNLRSVTVKQRVVGDPAARRCKGLGVRSGRRRSGSLGLQRSLGLVLNKCAKLGSQMWAACLV